MTPTACPGASPHLRRVVVIDGGGAIERATKDTSTYDLSSLFSIHFLYVLSPQSTQFLGEQAQFAHKFREANLLLMI